MHTRGLLRKPLNKSGMCLTASFCPNVSASGGVRSLAAPAAPCEHLEQKSARQSRTILNQQFPNKRRATPFRYIVLVFGMLISSLGLFWGCASDPYANLKITANTNSIYLQMDIDENGYVVENNKNWSYVIFSISGAPDVISRRVNVTSLDETVARVVGEPEVSGDRTRVKIVAANGGHTQLRGLTAGGGKDTYVDIVVDIPARAVEVKPEVQFGITKDGTLKLEPEHFNLYASSGVRDSRYATTLNEIRYALEGSPNGVAINPTTGELSLSSTSDLQPGSKIRLSATLTHTDFVLNPIEVYVFEKFTPITLNGINTPAGSDVPVVELIRNGKKGENGGPGEDTINTSIAFKSNPSPSISWSHEKDSRTGNVAKYGYFVENYDPNIVLVIDAQNTNFSLYTSSTGQTYIDVVLFPIAADGTRFDGAPAVAKDGKTYYRRPSDMELWSHQLVKVEIRHVFKDKVSNVNHLQILHNEEVLGSNELIALYPNGAKVTESERRRFNITLSDGIVVNNTDQVPNNNHVMFEWVSPALPQGKTMWDIFDITYCTRVTHDHTTDPILTQSVNSQRGVPYNALFSITLKDPEYIGANMVLRVKSVAKKNGVSLGSVDIKVYGAQSIKSIQAYSQLDGIAGAISDISLPKLYPVRGLGSSTPYEFFLLSDKKTSADRFSFENYDTSLFSFSTTQISTPLGNVIKVTMNMIQPNPSAYLLGKDYDLRIRYVSGFSVDVKIEVLDQLSGFTMESIEVQEVSGEQVYDVNYNTQNKKITTYVRINATYTIKLPSSLTRAGVRFEITGIDLFGDNYFKLTEEKTYSAELRLFALNPQVFPPNTSLSYSVDIVVVNSIVSAWLSKSFVQVLSDNTLGMDDEAASKETIFMNMTFASGTVAKNMPVISFKLDDNAAKEDKISSTFVSVTKKTDSSFEIQGLRGNSQEVVVYFFVKQQFGNTEIDFTFGKGIPLYIRVNDALQVESIRPATEFLQIELNGQNKDVQIRATIYPNAAPRVPYNTRLGYGLEVGGVWHDQVNGIIETEHLRLNTVTGQLTAKKSTRGLTQGYYSVVIYSRDSVKALKGNEKHVAGINPRTFARLSVQILNNAADEYVISSKQEFLEIFYTGKNELNGEQTWRSRTASHPNSTYEGFYQIAADIDLTGEYLEPIHNFNGTLSGAYAYAMAGGRKIAQYNISGIEILQPHVAVHTTAGARVTGSIARYGFISQIGAEGVVEGLNFRMASSFAQIDSGGAVGAAGASLGVLAAINYGIVRDVAVYVSQQRSLSVIVSSAGTVGQLFVGGLVGLNYGLIEENVVGVYATGEMIVSLGRYIEVCAGGLAGANFGKMNGETAARILEENILTNSDMVISIMQPNTSDFAGLINAGGVVGYNAGEINKFSSEAAIYNATRGNSGGLIGRNHSTTTATYGAVSGKVYGCYSNGALYAQGAIGGLVGRNEGGALSESYYDFYVNTKVKNSLAGILAVYGNPDWFVKSFYAGIIVSGAGQLTPNTAADSDTVVGGVVGINNGGTLSYCFASSAFDKDTGDWNGTKFGEVLGLRFMGDIFINEGRNVVVGGLIGRSTGTTGVSRGYSNLSIYYQSDTSGTPRTHTIAGLIGEVRGGTSNFTYCYSSITLNLRGSLGNVGIGGLLGRAASGSCVLTLCYSLVDSSSVSVAITVQPIALDAANVTDYGVRTAATVPSAATSLSGWTGNGQNASTGFINCASNAAALECKFSTQGTHANCIGGGMPMLRAPGADVRPLYIAKPVTITLSLRTHDGANGYKSIYGNSRNDRGGFNFVVPETPTGLPSTNRAALFFSSGDYQASSITANRYYIDDLFTTKVSPDIAKRRVAARIDAAGSDIAEIGYETVWVESKGVFEPRYYVDIKRLGYFELVIESTRDINTPPSVAARIRFDIVDGISYQSVVSNFVGTVGYKTLLTADESNNVNFSHNFSARRNQSFFFRAGADNLDWNFLIRESSANLHTTNIDPWSLPSSQFSNNMMPNGRIFRYNETGYAVFSFIPYLVTPTGGIYHARALEIRLRVQIYAGATELTLGQSANKLDGTNTSSFDGKIVTDVTFSSIENPRWDWNTTLEQRLLTLVDFKFSDGKNSEPHQLFGRTSLTELYSVTTRVPIRSNAAGSEQSFILVFNLRDVKCTTVDGYDVYTFKVLLSIEVDSDALYNDKTQGHFETGVNAILQGVKGALHAREIQYSKNSHGEPLVAKGDVEVYAQDLQNVEFQHYARTNKIGVDGLTLGIENGLSGEGQQQSMNIFTENGVGGLFKIYALPYFSNIDRFTMSSTVYTQKIYDARGKEIGSESWDISFQQMIWDVQARTYVSVSTNDKSYAGASFIQFSEKNGENYSWTGVYYSQTNLRYLGGVPTMRVAEGTRFDITATFVTNGKEPIDYKTVLFALNMPGIYYDHDGEFNVKDTTQAVGTSVSLYVSTVGTVKLDKAEAGMSGPNFYTIDVPSQPSLKNLIKLEYDAPANRYNLIIDPSFPYAGSIENVIVITFHGTIEENGLRLPVLTPIKITPVLFKLKGFKLVGITGNNIRLINQNRQVAVLQAVVSQYTREAANILFGSVNDMLLSTIQAEVSRFNAIVNASEDVFWEGVVDGAYWQLNNKSFDSSSEYYNRNLDKGLNFVLGKSSRTQERFIMAAVAEEWQRTNGLSVEVFFKYNNGTPVVWSTVDRTGAKSLSAIYNVITVRQSAEDNPEPIYKSNAWQLQWMTDPNAHYILMEDIELTSWTPVQFAAASLDGNNKKLTINGFALSATLPSSGATNVGLFTEVARNSVLKNINLVLPRSLGVDLTQYQFTQQSGTSNERNTVNIGALVGTNNGIITNCAVLTDSQFTGPEMGERVNYKSSTYNRNLNAGLGQVKGHAQSRLEVFANSVIVNIRLGGLAGNNGTSGVISNCRVMVDVYLNGPSSDNDIDTTNRVPNVRTASVAGLVAANSGHIVSSYFRDANIINNSVKPNEQTHHYTAGLVVTNASNAAIKDCYAMGLSTEINDNGSVQFGEIRSSLGVSAFVYENAGLISDCYSNIIISAASFSAGMIYTNTGTIRNSFALNPTTGRATHSGFINTKGGILENNRYLTIGQSATQDLTQAEAERLYDNDFKDINKFVGFSIGAIADADYGQTWKMTANGPRLVSADNIAISIRNISPPIGDSVQPIFYYIEGFNYGSARNPVLLTDGTRFNRLVYEGTNAHTQDAEYSEDNTFVIDYEQNVYEGHLRLVNNITLPGAEVQTHKATFRNGVLDGNSLMIDGISIIATELEVAMGHKSVGLFSKVEYSTIKNLNLRFVTSGAYSILATDIMYVGGLAGVSVNSNIINVHTTGAGEIVGKNFVGGVIGAAVQFNMAGEQNEYKIENISSSLNVNSVLGNADNFPSYISAIDYMKFNYTMLGVAGGAIGFVTNSPAHDRDFLIKDANGDPYYGAVGVPQTSVANIRNNGNVAASIRGAITGGLIGVIDNGIVVKNAIYQPSSGSGALRGRFYVGGIAGANFGTIEGVATNSSRISGANGAVAMRVTSSVGMTGTDEGQFISKQSFSNGVYDEHRGLVVGGVAGFNSGVINNIMAAIDFTGGTNPTYNYFLAVGGVAGENRGGKITNCTMGGNIRGGFIVGVIIGMNFDNGAVISGNQLQNYDFTNIIKEQGAEATAIHSLFVSGAGRIFVDNVFGAASPTRAGVTGGIVGYNMGGLIESAVRSANSSLPSGVAVFGTRSIGR